MAETLGSAVLNLTTDATKLTRGLQQAERQTDQSLTRMQKLGDLAAKAAPYAAIGAAAVGAGIGLKALVDDVANVERELRPFIARSNIGVESLQQWQEIGRQLGAEDPLEGITDSIQEFKLRLGELETEGTGRLTTALPALGLALEDLKGKTPEEQFRTLLTALQAVDDETRRLYLADELFGGAMENIIGILQAQAKEFQAVETAVRNTHNVLTGEELQKLKDYNLAVDDIGNTWDGLKQDLVTGVAPALSGFFGILSDELEYQKDLWSDGKDLIADWSNTALEAFSQVGPGIRVSLEEIPTVIGEVMTSEEADIAGYIGNQMPLIKVAWEDIAQTTFDGATDTMTRLQEGMSVETVNTHMALVNEAIAEAMRTTVTNAQETADQLVEIDTATASERLTIVTQATQDWQAARDAAHAEAIAAEQAYQEEMAAEAQANADRITEIMSAHTQNWVALAAAGRSQDRANATAWANHVADEANRMANDVVAAAQRAATAIANIASRSLAKGLEDQQGFDRSKWVRVSGDPWNSFGGDYYRNTETGEEISTRLFQSRSLAAAKAKQHETIVRGGLYSDAYPDGQPLPSLPGLPSMDSGGIVSGPTLAALAMNSRPEAVIPLDRMGAGGVGGVHIHFEGPVYGMDDFRDKVQEATLLGNRMGRDRIF